MSSIIDNGSLKCEDLDEWRESDVHVPYVLRRTYLVICDEAEIANARALEFMMTCEQKHGAYVRFFVADNECKVCA